jgi:hypothetical protein
LVHRTSSSGVAWLFFCSGECRAWAMNKTFILLNLDYESEGNGTTIPVPKHNMGLYRDIRNKNRQKKHPWLFRHNGTPSHTSGFTLNLQQ